jgi:hypothetical protein
MSGSEPSDVPVFGSAQQREDEKLRDLAIALMPHLPKNSDDARRVLTILADLITFRESGHMPTPQREELVGHEDRSEG